MHDKIYSAINEKVLPLEFIGILIDCLNSDLNELSEIIQFFSELESLDNVSANITRTEMLSQLKIRKNKYVELVSEIEIYYRQQ